MWLMLQTLLADRFKLAMHNETRNLPVYDLEVVRSAPKLQSAAGTPCSEVLTALPERGQPRPAPPCGPGLVKTATGVAMEGISVSMPAFAKVLSTLVGKEVIDKTGFKVRSSPGVRQRRCTLRTPKCRRVGCVWPTSGFRCRTVPPHRHAGTTRPQTPSVHRPGRRSGDRSRGEANRELVTLVASLLGLWKPGSFPLAALCPRTPPARLRTPAATG
jgi:hypothetical protein